MANSGVNAQKERITKQHQERCPVSEGYTNPQNIENAPTRKRNGMVEGHKNFLYEFPKVNSKQKFQTIEAFMHSHVDAKHIALSKLQSSH